jgi:cyanate permease
LIPDAINDVYSFDEMAELEVEGEEFEEELSKENKKKIRKINIVTLI